jgi:hypothetical protein
MRKRKSEFEKLRGKLFISRKQASELFSVTERTIRNWDQKNAPAWALRELLRHDRQLSGYHPAWNGFRIGWDGWLYGPNKVRVNPESLRRSGLFFGCQWRDENECTLAGIVTRQSRESV